MAAAEGENVCLASPASDWPDVRLRGFADHASLSTAWAWLDARPTSKPQAEVVAIRLATSRVLADEIICQTDVPDADRAASDGYAVRAADCDGANTYNPLTLAPCESGITSLSPGAACPIASGWRLPDGTDAVLPFEAAERTDAAWLEVLAPIPSGTGIERRGHQMRTGTQALRQGQTLLPQHVACLAALGLADVAVLPRPLVRLLVPGPKSGADGLTPLLLALLTRDGARVETIDGRGDGELDLAAVLPGQEPGIVLIAGRSGIGPDDFAPVCIQAAGGILAMHGLALRPGGSVGLGTLFDQPVILLPGDAFACLAAYDMLAARLVRRLAGVRPTLPYATAWLALDRKIVSAIGVTDIIPVRISGGRAQPLSVESGLGAMLSDGFVVVPEANEGHPAGASVRVHLYSAATSGSGWTGSNEHDHA